MRIALARALAALAALAAGAAPARADDAADVRQVLERFDRAWEARDADQAAALVARDQDVVFFGSDIGDRWVGWNAIRAGLQVEFKRSKALQIQAQPATVHVRGALAWFERNLVVSLTTAGGEMSIFTRATGVLEKRGAQWLLVQSHTSVGAPRESGPRE